MKEGLIISACVIVVFSLGAYCMWWFRQIEIDGLKQRGVRATDKVVKNALIKMKADADKAYCDAMEAWAEKQTRGNVPDHLPVYKTYDDGSTMKIMDAKTPTRNTDGKTFDDLKIEFLANEIEKLNKEKIELCEFIAKNIHVKITVK